MTDTRICMLASGSNGNAFLVQSGSVCLLVDVGIGPRVLSWRLAPMGLSPSDITHVVLTHEHHDHVKGIEPLLRRQPELVLWASKGTAGSLHPALRRRTRRLVAGQPVVLGRGQGEGEGAGAVTVWPFSTSHDAVEPMGFRIETPAAAVGYATDLGCAGPEQMDALSGLDALVLESNHCVEMLARGPYSAFLKRRVAGPQGHLSNHQAAGVLERLAGSGIRFLRLAHLSAVNNTPGMVTDTLAAVIRGLPPRCRWDIGRRDGALEAVVLERGCGPVSQRSGQPQLRLPW